MSISRKAFTDIFIQRPVLAIVLSTLIVLAGVQAILTATSGKSGGFTVREYPRSDNSNIVIRTVYVGASADLVRGFITTPIERAISAADGIDYIESSSTQSLSTITVRLKLNFDPVKALSEISAKVDQVRADLPPESEVPTIEIESAASSRASMYLSFRSKNMEPNEVTDYLVRVVQPVFQSVPGVQRAEILGGRTYSMRVWLKPDALAAYNISPSEVRLALAQNNSLAAIGKTKGNYYQVNLTANTDLTTVEEFENLVVRTEGRSLIRLADVADVELGAEDYDADVRFSGEEAVFMGIWVLPTANTLDTIAGVRDVLDELKLSLPPGFEADIGYDATKYIEVAIEDVTITLLETLGIVVIVIFLFMGSVRTVLVPVVAIPISLVGAIFMMQMLGFSINLLTLLAIVLAVGLVVDDAIIVVENVERNLRNGLSPMDAALQGTRELIGPVIATTIVLVAVYTPVAFQGGLTGSLFKEFAITLAGAVVISSIVALTLSPMLASRVLKPGMGTTGFSGVLNRFFDNLRDVYRVLVADTLKHRPLVYTVWIVITLSVAPLFIMSSMSTELAPTEDQGVVFTVLNTSAENTVEQTAHYATAIQEAFESLPEYNYSFQIAFPAGGFGGVLTDPWSERDRNIIEIRQQLMGPLFMIPGLQLFPVLPAALPGGSDFPVEFVLASTADSSEVIEVAKEVAQKATASGFFAFPPTLDVKYDEPQAELVIDRDRVADLGLRLQDVTNDVGTLLGGNFVNRFSIDGRSYKVIPLTKRNTRLNAEQLEDYYVSGPNGDTIPLSTIARIENKVEPRSLNRFNQLNSVKITGIPAAPLDSALAALEEAAAEVMPRNYRIDYGGESRQLRLEESGFMTSFGLALVLIFLALAVQFNSFRDPFIILLGSVPLGLFGALIFTALRAPGDPWTPHWSWGWTTTWNIYSQVGVITLIGLVSKNSILIVEFANVLQEQGMSKIEAAREAAATRLRPILMTSAATIFGHMMLVFVTGAGAAARNSIGLVLVCGMAIGTFCTLFILPSIYVLMARNHQKDLDREESHLTGEPHLTIDHGTENKEEPEPALS